MKLTLILGIVNYITSDGMRSSHWILDLVPILAIFSILLQLILIYLLLRDRLWPSRVSEEISGLGALASLEAEARMAPSADSPPRRPLEEGMGLDDLEEEIQRELAALDDDEEFEAEEELDSEGSEGGGENDSWEYLESLSSEAAELEALAKLEALEDFRAQMKSRCEDCDVVIGECDEVLREARDLGAKADKKANKKLAKEFSGLSISPSETPMAFKDRILQEIDELENREKDEAAADEEFAAAAAAADFKLSEVVDDATSTLTPADGVVSLVHEHDVLERLVKRALRRFDEDAEAADRRRREEEERWKKEVAKRLGFIKEKREDHERRLREEMEEAEACRKRRQEELEEQLAQERSRVEEMLGRMEEDLQEAEATTATERSKMQAKMGENQRLLLQRREQAATTLQAAWRGWRSRKAWRDEVVKRTWAWRRRRQEERIEKIVRERREGEKRKMAATKIEAAMRGFLARRKFRGRIVEGMERRRKEREERREREKREKWEAAATIQRMWRATVGAQVARAAREEWEEKRRKEEERRKEEKRRKEEERKEEERRKEEKRLMEEEIKEEERRKEKERKEQEKREKEKEEARERERRKMEEEEKKTEKEKEREEKMKSKSRNLNLEKTIETKETEKSHLTSGSDEKIFSPLNDDDKNEENPDTMEKGIFLTAPTDEAFETSRDDDDDAHNAVDDNTLQVTPMPLDEDFQHRRLAWMQSCSPWTRVEMAFRHASERAKLRPPKRAVSGLRRLVPLAKSVLLTGSDGASLKTLTRVSLAKLPNCKLTPIGECPNLVSLEMRFCDLSVVHGLQSCEKLRFLNLNNNRVESVFLQKMPSLQIVDLSHNELTSIHGLEGCLELRLLNLSHNRIMKVGGLETLTSLQFLDLSHNGLVNSQGLVDACSVQILNLSHNHLKSIEGLSNLCLLQLLHANSNMIAAFPDFSNQVLLHDVELEDNAVADISTASTAWLPCLVNLSLGNNALERLPPLKHLLCLESLDVSRNCVADPKEIEEPVRGLKRLKHLDYTGNPMAAHEMTRTSFANLLPTLRTLNRLDFEAKGGFSSSSSSNDFERMCELQAASMIASTSTIIGIIAEEREMHRRLKDLEEEFRKSRELAVLFREAHEFGSVCADFEIELERKREEEEERKREKEEKIKKEEEIEKLNEEQKEITKEEKNKRLKEEEEKTIKEEESKRLKEEEEKTLKEEERKRQKEEEKREEIQRREDEKKVRKQEEKIRNNREDEDEKKKEESKEKSEAELKSCAETKQVDGKIRGEAEKIPKEFSISNLPSTSSLTKNAKISPLSIPPVSEFVRNRAARVIQRRWRLLIRQRYMEYFRELQSAATTIQRSWRKWRERRHRDAATTIQRMWRGFDVRNRLRKAREWVKRFEDEDEEEEDEFSEVRLDAFEIDDGVDDWRPNFESLDDFVDADEGISAERKEAWRAKREETSKIETTETDQPRFRSPVSRTSSVDTRARGMSPLSADSRARVTTPSSVLSLSRLEGRRRENIRQDWGFRDADTAVMMYRRAKKMKYRAESKTKKQRMDPLQKLAALRRKEAEDGAEGALVGAVHKKSGGNGRKEYFEARAEAFAAQDVTPREEKERRQDFTYKWLDQQASFYSREETEGRSVNKKAKKHGSSLRDSLPRLTPDALRGRPVNLTNPDTVSVSSFASSKTGSGSDAGHAYRATLGPGNKGRYFITGGVGGGGPDGDARIFFGENRVRRCEEETKFPPVKKKGAGFLVSTRTERR